MTLPQELIAAAVIGIAQHTLSIQDEFKSFPMPENDIEKLLVLSATLGLREASGWTPARDHRALPTPCPLDEQPPLSLEAMSYLTLIWSGHFRETLPEWFYATAQAGKRVPEEYLPLVLSIGRHRKDLREVILTVIGQRGRWLAEQIKDQGWNWFTVTNAEKVWSSGSLEARLLLFENLRRSNSARARELLAGYQDKQVGVQESFLELMRIGLCADDEPILENALNSKVKEVHYIAADLLGRLPDSQFNQRMLRRAEAILTQRKPLLSNEYQLLLLQCNYDDNMKRDGIQEEITDKVQFGSPQLWWMTQILAFIRPTYWCQQFNMTPDKLLEASNQSNRMEVLWRAWIVAANRNNDSEFACQMLQHAFRHWKTLLYQPIFLHHNSGGEQKQTYLEFLMATVKPGDRRMLAAEWLAAQPFAEAYPLRALLLSLKETWSSALTQVFVQSLEAGIEQGITQGSEFFKLMSEIAIYVHPSWKDRLLQVLEKIASKYPKGVKPSISLRFAEPELLTIRTLLDFRAEMRDAIEKDI